MSWLTQRGRLQKILCEHDVNLEAHEISIPPKVEMGHFAVPCFSMAKTLKKAPSLIAQQLAETLTREVDDLQFLAAGPYLNVKIPSKQLYQNVVGEVGRQKELYGSDQSGKNQKIVIDYGSPNIAKKLAFQHIRSFLIGNTLSRVFQFLGYEITRINYVGDWGTQFAKLLFAMEKWGKPDELLRMTEASAVMDQLFEWYVRYHREEKDNPDFAIRVSEIFTQLEKNDPTLLNRWKFIRDKSIECMEQVLDDLNVEFDVIQGESDVVKQVPKILDKMNQRSLLVESEGARVVILERSEIPALIQKSDGTTLYMTRDIAAAEIRKRDYQYDQSLYVVASQQSLHFQQLFEVLEKYGDDLALGCEHLAFGIVHFGDQKMSTRDGNVIFLEDVIAESCRLAEEECLKKNSHLKDVKGVAKKIGLGALIFGELSSHRQRDFQFTWEHAVNLEGDTGPYVQYAVVRSRSLLKKAEVDTEISLETLDDSTDYELLAEEETLLFAVSRFRFCLHQCLKEKDTFLLTQYLIDLAKTFNRFYFQVPVLKAETEQEKNRRLNIVKAATQTLSNGLRILGVECPEEM